MISPVAVIGILVLLGIILAVWESETVRSRRTGHTSSDSSGSSGIDEAMDDTRERQHSTSEEEEQTMSEIEQGQTDRARQEEEEEESEITAEVQEIESIEQAMEKILDTEEHHIAEIVQEVREIKKFKKKEKELLDKLEEIDDRLEDGVSGEELVSLLSEAKQIQQELENIEKKELDSMEDAKKNFIELHDQHEDTIRDITRLREVIQNLDEEEYRLERIQQELGLEKNIQLEKEEEKVKQKFRELDQLEENYDEHLNELLELLESEREIDERELNALKDLLEKDRELEQMLENSEYAEVIAKLEESIREIIQRKEKEEEDEESMEKTAEKEANEGKKAREQVKTGNNTGNSAGKKEDPKNRNYSKEPWMLAAKNPNKTPDWENPSQDFWKDGWAWMGGWMFKGKADANQGWKIHIAVNPENKEEVYRVAKAIMPVLNNMEGERKFAKNGQSLIQKAQSSPETKPKLCTIYPAQDGGSDIVNQNRENTQEIISNLIEKLHENDLLGATEGIETVGEFNITEGGNPTRIFVRYDKIAGNKIKDNSGKPYEFSDGYRARKPGVLPQGYAQKYNIQIEDRYLEELPELKPLETWFDTSMVLFEENIQ